VSDAANDSAVGGKSTAAAAAKVLTAATNPTASAAAAQASVPTTNPPGTPPRFAPFTATANLGSSASANPPGAAAAAPSFSGGTGAITPPAPPSGLAAKFPQLPMAATLDFQKSEKEFLNRNGYVLVDCGDGKRSESCLFASILAQVDGGCMMASLDRCAKERAARLVFAFDYIQKCVNGISDDELPDFAKKAICALMKRLTMRDNSIVRDTQMLQLLSECIVAGDAFVADRDGKLTAAKADAENQIQRLRGENSGYLSVYLIGVDQPSESDPERFRKGYDAARKTCAEKGLKTEDDVSMLMAENASLEAKQQYIIDSKKKDVEWALGRLRALVSATGPSDGGNVKIPCLETLAAIFSLFAETFSTAGLNAFSKKHSTFDGSVNLLPKHFRFAGDENLGPIFYGIVYFLSVADKFSGACDMQDVAIEALRLNRDIVVYDEVHKTWIVFKWDGSDESYPPRNQLVKPIFLKHIRGHFQAYLPKGRAPK
ncbi:MAG: hypothetical protein LBI39_03275, partial [Puniceicoccales bacterium]|jgi:hypothetical protein|nr:hypothetical protein [Puniceicoccales bacterium]